MRRTLQTTLLALKWLVEAGVPIEVDAMWQDKPCDTGSPLDRLTGAFPELDFSHVDPTYPDKSHGTPYAYTRAANRARGQACLRALHARPERVLAVVSHAGFLRTGVTQRRFANADYRIFTFARGAEGELELREDPQTEESGGGTGRSEKGVFGIRPDEFPDDDGEQEAR